MTPTSDEVAQALRDMMPVEDPNKPGYEQSLGEPETDHKEADRLLLEAVPENVRVAYLALREEIGFWYS